MYLTRHSVRKALGRDLVLWIDPRCIELHWEQNQPLTHRLKEAMRRTAGRWPLLARPTSFVNKVLYSAEPFAVPARWFPKTQPLTGFTTWQRIHDFVVTAGGVPRKSLWYASLCEELKEHGEASHKGLRFRSIADIDGFFATYVHDLVSTMATHGYMPGKASDEGTALVDSAGRLVKSAAGSHRFSVAHVLGVSRVPVEVVGVHADWMRDAVSPDPSGDLRSALRAVEAAHRTPPP